MLECVFAKNRRKKKRKKISPSIFDPMKRCPVFIPIKWSKPLVPINVLIDLFPLVN